MIGPTEPRTADARITRRVETVETAPSGEEIRFQIDTAAVRLEMLPVPSAAVALGATEASGSTTSREQPVAVYAITPFILLASYEPCVVTDGAPRLTVSPT